MEIAEIMGFARIPSYSPGDVVLFGRIRSGMKPVKTCSFCGRSTSLPHTSETDCFRALDQEIRATLAHLRSLTKRKSQLLRVRIRRRQKVVSARRKRAL